MQNCSFITYGLLLFFSLLCSLYKDLMYVSHISFSATALQINGQAWNSHYQNKTTERTHLASSELLSAAKVGCCSSVLILDFSSDGAYASSGLRPRLCRRADVAE